MHRRHGEARSGAAADRRHRQAIDLFDEDAAPALTAALAGDAGSALNSKVLVLNRLYVAIRVVSARRAFCLLMREIAEVIDVSPTGGPSSGPSPGPSPGQEARSGDASATPMGAPATSDAGAGSFQFLNYDFATWADLAALQRQFEPNRYDWVRTVRMEIAVPRIIRLLGYDRLPEQSVKLNRRNLFARDRNSCQYCGRHFSTSDLSIDHVVPRAHGGQDTWENLVCACIRCNARKGGRTPDQARMTLVRKPERPRRNPVITLRLGHDKYRSWRAFLDHAYWDVELK